MKRILIFGVVLAACTALAQVVVMPTTVSTTTIYPTPATAPVGYTFTSATTSPAGQIQWAYDPIPPTPIIPPLAWHICPTSAPAMTYGVNVLSSAAPVILSDSYYQGYHDDIAIQNAPSVKLHNVRTVGAWRNPASQLYAGQGIYLFTIHDGAAIDNWFAWGNGWDGSRDWWERNIYRHDAYLDEQSGPATIDTFILAEGSACGVQNRTGSTQPTVITNGFIFSKSIAICATYGPVHISHSTIYSGHFAYDGAAWTSNTAIEAYWPVTLDDVWIVGSPGQINVPVTSPMCKAYPQGCIVNGGTWKPSAGHTWSPPPPGPLITATNCRIAGWPGATFNNIDPPQQSGFTVTANPVTYDPRPILLQVQANTMTIQAAQQKLQADVRALVH